MNPESCLPLCHILRTLSFVQLVCLSATLPNADTVATWLDASLYQTGFRPVELRHHVCRGRVIYAPGADKGRQGEDQDAEAISLVKVMLTVLPACVHHVA